MASLRRQLGSLRETVDRQGLLAIEDAIRACQDTRRLLERIRSSVSDSTYEERTILLDGLACGIAQVNNAMSELPQYGTQLEHAGYYNIRMRLRVAVAIGMDVVREMAERDREHRLG